MNRQTGNRQTNGETVTWTNIHVVRHTDGQTEIPKEADGQTDRKQRNKWRNREVDKQTCRQAYK
jgi:hypothetical protein